MLVTVSVTNAQFQVRFFVTQILHTELLICLKRMLSVNRQG